MDPSFIPISTVPGKTPFGLDQLQRAYKTALSAEDAIAAAPAVGDADEVFPNMFLMPVSTPESAESATRIDLLYMGCFAGDEGAPVLPAPKHDSDTAVQSASSSYGSSGASASAITIQYYAPTNTLSYFSFGAVATTDATDPTADPVIISLTVGGINFTPGSIPDLVTTYFTTNIVATISSIEIVPGQYWQNVARKTKGYLPFVVTPLPPGTAIIQLATPGTDYAVGDIVTITAGGESAVMTVTGLGVSGSIFTYDVTFNNFTVPQNQLSGSGGGVGAKFNVLIF